MKAGANGMSGDRSTRRDWLGQSAGALALAATSRWPLARAAEEESLELPAIETGYIDAHVHVWTPDTVHFPLGEGWTVEAMQPPSFTPEELLAHAAPCNVARIVLIQMSFYGYDNSYMLDAMQRFPGRFGGVAVIDHHKPRTPGQMRRLHTLGVRGFRIRPAEGQTAEDYLQDDAMQAFWKQGAELGMAMCGLLDPAHLPAWDAMCEQHPDTPAVIDHFARIGVDGQIRAEDVAQLCKIARHANAYVKVSAFYALGKKQSPYTDLGPMIRQLLDAYGPQRLMWATDCPYQVQEGHTYADSVALIAEQLDFLSADERTELLRGTAQRVFFS